MIFFAELFPTLIYEVFSSFSGPIRVVESHGEKRLMIGNIVQSISLENPIGHKVWGRLADFPFSKNKISSILVLGLGGGTVTHLLSKRLNPRKIVGVEIDPVVIEVGKKYFGLNNVKNLRIVTGDAQTYIKDNSEKYDYIIVDTYQGSVFPKVLEGDLFLNRLKDALSTGGILVFNRIFRSSKPERRFRFLSLLEKIFGEVKEEIIEGPSDAKNYLYWISASCVNPPV